MILLITTATVALMAQNKCEFIFKYGVGKKNVLNTRGGMFTKDMVSDPAITIPMKLTRKEKKHIYKKLVEIHFFDLPENYEYKIISGETITQVNPCSTYELEIFRNDADKVVNWNNCSPSVKDSEFQKLMDLADLINSIVVKKQNYKNLPQPKSAYH